MKFQKQIGQLFWTGIEGLSLSNEEAIFLKDYNLGGVLLFSRNYQEPAQLAELINEIQSIRNEVPFFIAVDQEGGRVQRFKDPFTVLPPAKTLGEIDSPKLTFEAYSVVAKELQAVGINVNLAPVADILFHSHSQAIGDRAFSSDVEVVQRHVSAVIRAHQVQGIMACAKHFPGHGRTAKDSHHDLPYITESLSVVSKEELLPFIKAVKSRVDMIMMGHLVFDAFDANLPASLSEKTHKFLRDELKFSKLIISDDMVMDAVDELDTGIAPEIMALRAGSDILEYRFMSDAKRALENVLKAFNKQELAKEKLQESLKRVAAAKEKYLANYRPVYIPDLSKKLEDAQGSHVLEKIQKKLAG